MNPMNALVQLEVSIKKIKSVYKAKCNAFPKCIGQGKTEKEALSKLGVSISRVVGKMAKTTFDNLVLSDKYTEILLDNSKKGTEQRRVFQLHPQIQSTESKSFFMKIKLMPPAKQVSDLISEIDDDIHDLMDTADFPDQLHPPRKSHPTGMMAIFGNQMEGMVFGLPLNLN